MAITTFRYDAAGAPTLNGLAGSLIAVLDYALVAGMGWSKVYSGANLAVYRAPAGNRMFLRVDDTAGTYARVVGYESMTDVNTGTGMFPSAIQLAGGPYIVKSISASATPCAWAVVASDRGFYSWINTYANGLVNDASYANTCWFGDIKSYKPGDAYGTLLIANYNSSYQGSYSGSVGVVSAQQQGHYMARSYTQLGGSIIVGKFADAGLTSPSGGGGYPYPNPVDNGIYLSPFRIGEPVISAVRGSLPGAWYLGHSFQYFNTFDVISGTGLLAGRTFMVLRCAVAGTNSGAVVIETSNTWDV